MKMINGKIPVLMPPSITLNDLRELAQKNGYVLKHNDDADMVEFVPAHLCPRPACDNVVTLQSKTVHKEKATVTSIVGMQRKEKPESFLKRFKSWTLPDHDHEPTPPSAA